MKAHERFITIIFGVLIGVLLAFTMIQLGICKPYFIKQAEQRGFDRRCRAHIDSTNSELVVDSLSFENNIKINKIYWHIEPKK